MQYHIPSLCPLNTLKGLQLTLHHERVNFDTGDTTTHTSIKWSFNHIDFHDCTHNLCIIYETAVLPVSIRV